MAPGESRECARERFSARSLFALALLGYGLRLALWALSEGSNDVRAWYWFGRDVARQGLARTYLLEDQFNHPPLMGLWAAAVARLAGSRSVLFAHLFKVPALVVEAAIGLLLLRIWNERRRADRAEEALAAYALAPSAALIASYHGNTDPIYFFFVLAAAYLLETRRDALAAGLALAAALNVKLIPLLLVLPFATRVRGPRELARYATGVSVGALPFLALLATSTPDERRSFVANVFGYHPNLEDWGVELGVRVFVAIFRDAPVAAAARAVGDWYALHGGAVLLVASGAFALAIAGGVVRRFDAYEIAALVLSGFVLFASGFGLQYVGSLVAPLLACDIAGGVAVAAVTGLYLALVYETFLVHWWPLYSQHEAIPSWLAPLAALAWFVIARVAWSVARGASRVPSGAAERPG